MCYLEFNRLQNKPKLAECGHTICEYCISRIDRCCLCNKPFQNNQRDHLHELRDLYGIHRMVPGQEALPLLFDRFSRGRRGGQESFRDNYALLEMIDKVSKEYSQCPLTKEYEEFYCADCHVFVCIKCIDSNHESHCLRRLPLSMCKFGTNVKEIGQKIETGLKNVETTADLLTKAKEQNEELLKRLPFEINDIFNEMIIKIDESRQFLLRELKENGELRESSIKQLTSSCKSLEEQFNVMTVTISEYEAAAKAEFYKENLDLIENVHQSREKINELLVQSQINHGKLSISEINVLDRSQTLKDILKKLKEMLPKDPFHKNNPFNSGKSEEENNRLFRMNLGLLDDSLDFIEDRINLSGRIRRGSDSYRRLLENLGRSQHMEMRPQPRAHYDLSFHLHSRLDISSPSINTQAIQDDDNFDPREEVSSASNLIGHPDREK